MLLQRAADEVDHAQNHDVRRTVFLHELLVEKHDPVVYGKRIDRHEVEVRAREHDAMAVAVAL